MNFGFYDPEGEKRVQLTLTIDKNDFNSDYYLKGFDFNMIELVDMASASTNTQSKII